MYESNEKGPWLLPGAFFIALSIGPATETCMVWGRVKSLDSQVSQKLEHRGIDDPGSKMPQGTITLLYLSDFWELACIRFTGYPGGCGVGWSCTLGLTGLNLQ